MFENEMEENETEIDTMEVGQGQEEIRQNVEDIFEETEIITVSDSDSEYVYYEEFNAIIDELIAQREELETLQEYAEYKDLNIFEKRLEDYTVTEGILLLIFFALIIGMLLKLIGGIVTCKI